MAQIYKLPEFLTGRVDRVKYIRWLGRKASAHVKRDRLRLNKKIALSAYKQEIHRAVHDSGGNDWYTGEALEWEKISTYDNEASKSDRSIYKARFGLLPTVDHVLSDDGTYTFAICAWRTNDAKNDLSLREFVLLCQKVVSLHRHLIGDATAEID